MSDRMASRETSINSKNSDDHSVETLAEVFRCFICMEKLRDAISVLTAVNYAVIPVSDAGSRSSVLSALTAEPPCIYTN